MPSVHRKANRGNRFHGEPLFSVPFVGQEDRVINASAMCSVQLQCYWKICMQDFNLRSGMLVLLDDG